MDTDRLWKKKTQTTQTSDQSLSPDGELLPQPLCGRYFFKKLKAASKRLRQQVRAFARTATSCVSKTRLRFISNKDKKRDLFSLHESAEVKLECAGRLF